MGFLPGISAVRGCVWAPNNFRSRSVLRAFIGGIPASSESGDASRLPLQVPNFSKNWSDQNLVQIEGGVTRGNPKSQTTLELGWVSEGSRQKKGGA